MLPLFVAELDRAAEKLPLVAELNTKGDKQMTHLNYK